MFHASAAVGGGDSEFVGLRVEQPGHEATPARLEKSQDADLVCETILRIGTMVGLEHATVKSHLDGRAECILYLKHGAYPNGTCSHWDAIIAIVRPTRNQYRANPLPARFIEMHHG